ncbi:unnamed protein product [Durusdinium trenchii]|uniref:Uncharacterized protein n=1 Tax=Durusdinium trenchii TaxID=1381693 RepID=A0ABP0MGY4_9DINO
MSQGMTFFLPWEKVRSGRLPIQFTPPLCTHTVICNPLQLKLTCSAVGGAQPWTMRSSWQPDLEYMAALPTLDSLAPAAGNSWYSQGPQGPTAWRGPMPTIPQMGAPQAYGTRPLYCPMPTDLSAVQASGQWRANGLQTNPHLFQQQAIHDVSQLATMQALESKTNMGSNNQPQGTPPDQAFDDNKAKIDSQGQKKKKKKGCCC